MKIFITGSCGYVGKKLIEYLSGNPDISVVGLTRSAEPSGLKQNILYIQADLAAPAYLNRMPSDIDTVLYLAQSSAYRTFPDGAQDMFAINVAAVANLLDWSVKKRIKKFIFASTGNVYRQQNKRLVENDPVGPTSYYGATKLCAEHLILQYQSLFRTIILRFFSIYGPGQQGMMIPSMISKIKSGELITLAQNKGILLSPLYVNDAVEMLKRIIVGNLNNDIYNLCGNETISLAEIIEMFGHILNVNPNITISDHAVSYLMADGSKLYEAIDYNPKIKMEQGLKLVLNA